MTTTDTSGRGWARTGLALGGLVSVAANIAHSYIPPHTAPTGWRPQPGAVVGAICWPVFLFIAIEILARVNWRPGLWYWLLRFGGMLPVAAVAALVSYRHLSGLLAYYGEEPLVYHLGPLAVDGLMVMATAALLAINTHNRTPGPAVIASPTTVPAAPAAPEPTTATPPVAPAELVPAPPVARPAPATVVPAPRQSPARTTSQTASASAQSRPTIAVATRPEQANPPQAAPASEVPTAPTPGPAPSTPDSPVARVHAASPKLPVPAATLARARHLAEAHQATTGEAITPGQLAVSMRIDTATATQVLAVLNLTGPDQYTVRRVNGTPTGATG